MNTPRDNAEMDQRQRWAREIVEEARTRHERNEQFLYDPTQPDLPALKNAVPAIPPAPQPKRASRWAYPMIPMHIAVSFEYAGVHQIEIRSDFGGHVLSVSECWQDGEKLVLSVFAQPDKP